MSINLTHANPKIYLHNTTLSGCEHMKKIIIPILLVIFLSNPAFGFAGMGANDSTASQDLNNVTESDQDIALLQNLVEVDAVQLRSENKLLIRETLVFKNIGTKDFSGFLRLWVPDGAEDIKIGKVAMTMEARLISAPYVQNGNIISWQDYLKANDPLPPLYIAEYLIPAEPAGTLTTTKYYSKVFLYPTLTKQPASVVVKVVKSKDEAVEIKDESGESITASGEPKEEDNSILYGWNMPPFKEIKLEITKPAITIAKAAPYAILGLVIILVLSYPIIRKRSGKLQALEEKIKTSLKREEPEEIEEEVEEAAEEAFEEAAEEAVPEPEPGEAEPEEDAELEGKTNEELENLKAKTLSKLDELGREYKSGNLLDEEYEELRATYEQKLEKITRKLS